MQSPFDKSELQTLYRSRQMDALERVADALCAGWQSEVATGASEFQYLKNSLERDGKILGVRYFLKEIEKLANSN